MNNEYLLVAIIWFLLIVLVLTLSKRADRRREDLLKEQEVQSS